MSNVTRNSYSAGAESTTPSLRVNRQGSLVSVDQVLQWAIEGRIFHGFFGSATTPVTLDAAYAATDPDLVCDVPSGTTIIPLRVTVIFEAYGTAAIGETLTLVSRTLGAPSAGTAVTPRNYRTDGPYSSNVDMRSAPTVTDGNTTGSFELFRELLGQAILTSATSNDLWAPTKAEWTYLQGPPAVLVGPASMQTWAIAAAATGYIQYVWAEFPTADIR